MDRISELPDALLLTILSFLLSTKHVVPTMVLSKRFQFIWTLVLKLVFDDGYQDIEYGKFSRIVDMSLLLHKAPFLENLHFKVGQSCGVGDIPLWIRVVDEFSVRELIIEIDSSSSASLAILPRTLYTEFRMLVTLKLHNVILVDVSSPVTFPSLKLLRLESVKYPGDEFVNMFLSNCHVLERLIVLQCPGDNVTIFTVRVPSLKRLFVHKSPGRVANVADGFVIDAPSLKFLGILDHRGGFCVIENQVPNIVDHFLEHGLIYNALTKPLPRAWFEDHFIKIGLCKRSPS